MRAMILSAGLGKRMRPLTDHVPKPLIQVGTQCLIEFHLQRLAEAGVQDVVINTHWLAQQIPATLGDGSKWGLRLHYSHEPELLETAGGILQALPMLVDDEEQAFLLINGDIYSDFDLSTWLSAAPQLSSEHSAYLALVENPEHNPEGDFAVSGDAMTNSAELCLKDGSKQSYTYAGIALFHQSFFADMEAGRAQLGPKLQQEISEARVLGRVLSEYWLDVGTPERLHQLQQHLSEDHLP